MRDELRQFAPTTTKWVILTLTSMNTIFMLPVFFIIQVIVLDSWHLHHS
jgi:hypothetical protein